MVVQAFWRWIFAECCLRGVRMRAGRIVSVAAVVAVAIVGWQLLSTIRASAIVKSVEEQRVYYRLVSKYEHKGEIIDFDIVVGCGVRVTRYGDGDRSYDAFRDPTVYAKATKDGGAIWQIVPHACQGETSENGSVPKDFLPGALWFDSKVDFTLGIAYVTEDAYEHPKSKLKFLGASIHKATRTDWEAFQPIASQNLIEPRIFTNLGTWPPESEVKANLWNKAKLYEWWLPSYRCYGVARYELTSEAARALVRTLEPNSHSNYWMPPRERYRDFLSNSAVKGSAAINGQALKEIANFDLTQAQGYPTRKRGGMLRSGQPWSKLPPTIFPMTADDGIPWVSPDVATSQTIYRDIEISDGSKGLAYCYSRLLGLGVPGDLHIPEPRKREYLTRIDGDLIVGEAEDDSAPLDRPRPFFQDDRYYYERFSFGLN
jgi:hypothetical protein